MNLITDFCTLGKKGITIFRWKILVSQCRKILSRNPSVFQKFSGNDKNVRDKRGGGFTIFCQIVLSHSTESFRRGTSLCFRKIRVSKKFMTKRGLSHFSTENLVSHSTEEFRRGTLLCCVSQSFWFRKNWWIRGWVGGRSITIFCPKFFVSQCRKIS